MDERPIGLMDSGLGGLSVMRVLHKQLPDESLIFVGDQGHFPYGTKSQEELQQLVLKIGRFLVDQDIKMMIIACNTATGAALPLLQRELPVPVIGVIEPGATAAVNHHLKTVGVIGTASTIKKGAYPRTLHQLDAGMTVYSHAAQPMVAIVEHGLTGTPTAQQTVDTELAYFDQHPVDGLILGCTHFPFLATEIRQKMGDDVLLIDPAYETIKQAQEVLTKRNLLTDKSSGTIRLYTTGERADLVAGAEKWLAGQFTSCDHVDL
ncbi:MAG: glutamate racemase [Limosilactobacillus sp.]|uniref:glutamate racemase n=1 Tax=Limosilactobacillus sp. TaxID=2773925 RepID=UPI002A758736|nr:glutamate racemase [Limosilactobacillus sp.]MDD7692996.1 glutamate racemase [Lactobacillaceae bacterium]MDY2803126.1 glutamate racemase [Limosilactobacillus sp.]